MSDDESKTAGATEKFGRTRSPNFPYIDLKEATEKTLALYSKAKTHPVSLDFAAKQWDYTTAKSGSFAKCLAAIKSYGLVNVDGTGESRKVAVSKAGEHVVENGPERAKYLKECALRPSIFANVVQKYSKDGGLPPDEVLSNGLKWDDEFKFNKSTIDFFVAKLRVTLDYAAIDTFVKMPDEGGDEEPDGEVEGTVKPNNPHDPGKPHGSNKSPASPPPLKQEANMKNLTIPLSGGTLATLQVPIPLSLDDFEGIVGYLQLFKKTLTAKQNTGDDSTDPQ